MTAEPKSTPACLGEYAQAADKVMHAASLAYPGHRVRGLRDAAWLGRSKLPPNLSKFLQQLNVTYSMLRHLPAPEFGKLVDEVVAAFGGPRCGFV